MLLDSNGGIYIYLFCLSYHFQGVQGGKGEQGPAGPPGFQVSQSKHTEYYLWSDYPAINHHTTLLYHKEHDFRTEAKKDAFFSRQTFV